MRTKCVVVGLVCLLAGTAAFAGDSLWGTVISVQRGDTVTLSYGAGSYEIHIAGVDVPTQGPIAEQARKFVENLVLNKPARMRFEYRNKAGQMIARLFTDDPVLGIRDVGLELLRAGLARRSRNYEYKYGEAAAAEAAAQKARAGLWAQNQ